MIHAQPHQFWRSDALPFAECRRTSDSTACYAPHTHSTLSLGAVDQGRSAFQRGRSRHPLIRGDVVFIPAHEVHACNPATGSAWSYQMLYLDPDWVARVLGEIAENEIDIDCHPQADLPTAELYARLSRINAQLLGEACHEDKEAALVLFVGDVFTAETLRATPSQRDCNAALQRVRALIEARHRESLSLDELAAEARLSRYHLLRVFRRWTGMTPHDWQIDRRIQHARRLLTQDIPLADIALQLGFSDQSHFQRAFKQRVAATPGNYRRLHQRNFVQD